MRLGGLLLMAACAAVQAVAGSPAVPRVVRDALDMATVLVLPSRCAGVVVERATLVATARHCVDGVGAPVRVRLERGEEIAGRVVVQDDRTDQVIIRLREPAPVDPLPIARRSLIRGTVLYFQGNPERPRPQDVRLDDIGECGSLPDLPDAFFTSIRGTPGDSGSPVVDGGAEVVGLVHGGARCHIVTPAHRLLPLVRKASAAGSERVPPSDSRVQGALPSAG
jgi:S1-C subfamily serine protease